MIPLLCLLCNVICLSVISAEHIFFEEQKQYPINVGIEIVKHIETFQSPFEKIDIYATKQCGTMLVLDGSIQLTQWDNNAYHEMIIHVPLMNHPSPKRALIIGGGDGGSLTELIKYTTLDQIILCEIDEHVIRLSKKYFPEFAESFNDARVTVVIEDGARHIKNYTDYFDIIIIDASDPESPAGVLYSDEFYNDIHKALAPDGIMVAQAESPFFHKELIKSWHKRNTDLFPHAHYYYALVPSYPSGVIGFAYCSKKYPYNYVTHRNEAFLPKNVSYYTPEIHSASFVLPKFLKNVLEL